MLKIQVQDTNQDIRTLELPSDINLSLMEALKAFEYPIAATCGGMALCATCHVEVLKVGENILYANDTELDMIDTLPNATGKSRLACQIKVNEKLDNAFFVLKESVNE
jgi:ferredoxin